MISPTDRLRRDRVIALLRAFAAGKLTNDEYEERYSAILAEHEKDKLKDRALHAVWEAMWFCYTDSDIEIHRLEGAHALNPAGKKALARCILFLQTNLPYEWKRDSILPPLEEMALGLLTLGWWNRRQKKEVGNWDDVWPFRRIEDFEKAKLEPR